MALLMDRVAFSFLQKLYCLYTGIWICDSGSDRNWGSVVGVKLEILKVVIITIITSKP